MNHFFNGILLGLPLAILVGPILIAMVQTTLEKGFRAGVLVAMGIWISDILFILAVYYGIGQVLTWVRMDGLEQNITWIAGFVFIGLGFVVFFGSKQKEDGEQLSFSTKTNFNLLKEGFLVNTINPFTFFFWTTALATSYENNLTQPTNTLIFASGILCTIISTDFLKVFFAKKVRNWLTKKHVAQIRKLSGALLLLLGIGLFVKYFLF